MAREVVLTDGVTVTFVDDCDYQRVMNAGPWQLVDVRIGGSRTRYAARKLMGRAVYLHQFILRVVAGSRSSYIDHANNNGLDNRRANLRRASAAQNGRNRAGANRLSSSRFLGVARSSNGKKWQTYVGREFIGSFDSEIDAALAYDRAASDRYGAFAHLNLPWLLESRAS